MNKRRLGRGLEALLGREEGGFEPGSLEAAELLHVAVDQIDPNPYQPRRHFPPAEIAALADSLRQHGMLQPILVRAIGDRYQLIAGERRLRASIEAQLHEIPARVMDLDDQRVFELAMVENLQREDLNAVDKATAFREYLVTLRRHPGRARRAAGARPIDRLEPDPAAGASPGRPGRRSRLRDHPGACPRALLGLADPESQRAACRRVIGENLSVRQTEAPRGHRHPHAGPHQDSAATRPMARAKSPHLVELEQHLHQRFGTTVLIRAKTPDRGQIVIDYNSQEEFDRVSSLIRGGAAYHGS